MDVPIASNSFLLLLGLLGILISGIFFFIYLSFDSKYPKIVFDVIDGNVKRRRTRRLAGTMIVPDNLIYIMLNERKLMGDDIREYTYVFEKGKKVYLALEKNGILIPLKLESDKLKVEDYMFAQDITIRFINNRENAKEYIEKSNPLFMTIVNTLPYAILMSIFVLGMYFTVNSIIPPVTQASTLMAEKMEMMTLAQNQSLQTQLQILERLERLEKGNKSSDAILNLSSNYDILFNNTS